MFQTSSVHHQERSVQAVSADFGMCCNTHTTRHVQPLQSCRSYSYNFVRAGRVELYAYYSTYQSLHLQLVQNAPDDGPMRSKTRRANLRTDKNLLIKTTLCILLDYIHIAEVTTVKMTVWHFCGIDYVCYYEISLQWKALKAY